METLNIVKLAGIALLVALAISLGFGEEAAEAQTLFGLAHSEPDGPSTLYTIDPDTGAATEVGPTGFKRCSGMDFRAGTLFATCERDNPEPPDTHVLIMIDPTSGTGGVIGPTGVRSRPFPLNRFISMSDISFQNSGDILYAYLIKGNWLATIDVVSGKATAIEPTFRIGIPGIGNGIAFSQEDELFHANQISLNTLDLATGLATSDVDLVFPDSPSPSDRGCCDNVTRVNALEFHPDTRILYASVSDRKLKDPGVVERPHRNFLATIDITTGEVIIKGETVKGLDAIAFAPAATASSAASDPTAGAQLGDFKCYGVKRPKGSPKLDKIEVTLNDRFDGSIKTRVEKAESVCTPVPNDPGSTAGYTCYKIKDVKGQPKFHQLDVEVTNDLFVDGDEQALTLKKPKVICVPSTIVER